MKRPCCGSRWRLRLTPISLQSSYTRRMTDTPEISQPVPGIAGFDVGDRRIGIAVTDPLGYTAQPLLTIYRTTPRADLKSIGRLLRKHGVAEAVVGNPLNMSGEVGPRARNAQEFAEQLRVGVFLGGAAVRGPARVADAV